MVTRDDVFALARKAQFAGQRYLADYLYAIGARLENSFDAGCHVGCFQDDVRKGLRLADKVGLDGVECR